MYTLEVKRLYLPFDIKCKCSECDEELVMDLSEDYLSDPIINETESVDLYCDNCCLHSTVKFKLNISITQEGL